jgi:hypothetical protein
MAGPSMARDGGEPPASSRGRQPPAAKLVLGRAASGIPGARRVVAPAPSRTSTRRPSPKSTTTVLRVAGRTSSESAQGSRGRSRRTAPPRTRRRPWPSRKATRRASSVPGRGARSSAIAPGSGSALAAAAAVPMKALAAAVASRLRLTRARLVVEPGTRT